MIIKFEMEHCPMCRKLDSMLKALNYDPDKTYVLSPDDMEAAKKYNVSTCPTLLKIENDNVIDRLSGMVSVNRLKEFIKE